METPSHCQAVPFENTLPELVNSRFRTAYSLLRDVGYADSHARAIALLLRSVDSVRVNQRLYTLSLTEHEALLKVGEFVANEEPQPHFHIARRPL